MSERDKTIGVFVCRRNIEPTREVTLGCEQKAETALAILFDFGDKEAWVPKSQILHSGDNEITMPEWLARAKGLI
jgi:hypothetical protein